jgi:hypothetical protein
VQPKEQEPERHDHDQKEHRSDHHQNVSIAGGRNEDWQMVDRSRIHFVRH